MRLNSGTATTAASRKIRNSSKLPWCMRVPLGTDYARRRAGHEKAPPERGFFFSRRARSALHRTEELVVRLGGLHLLEQELHRGQFVHRMQQLAQDPD